MTPTNIADFVEGFLDQSITRLTVKELVLFGLQARRHQRSIQGERQFHSLKLY